MAVGDKTPIKWEDADFAWDLAPTDTTLDRYTWNDVTLVIEAIGGGGDMEEMPWTQWGDDRGGQGCWDFADKGTVQSPQDGGRVRVSKAH